MSAIEIYLRPMCPFCHWAKQLLDAKGAHYREIRIDREPNRRDEMYTRSGRRSVPQIFIGDQHIGGFDELKQLDQRGALDPLLNQVHYGK